MNKEKSKDGGSNDLKADWKDLKELQAFCEFCDVQEVTIWQRFILVFALGHAYMWKTSS